MKSLKYIFIASLGICFGVIYSVYALFLNNIEPFSNKAVLFILFNSILTGSLFLLVFILSFFAIGKFLKSNTNDLNIFIGTLISIFIYDLFLSYLRTIINRLGMLKNILDSPAKKIIAEKLLYIFSVFWKSNIALHLLFFIFCFVFTICWCCITNSFLNKLSAKHNIYSSKFKIKASVCILLVFISTSAYSYISYASNTYPQDISETSFTPIKRKALILGLDSATWSMIKPLIEQGKLPNIKRLMDNGVYANLKSIKYFKSPSIWTSIVTGQSPDEHGIKGFNSNLYNFPPFPQLALYNKRVGTFTYQHLAGLLHKTKNLNITNHFRKVKALWNILSEYGYKVGFLGWWASRPAEIVNGFILTDRINKSLVNTRQSESGKISNDISELLLDNDLHPPQAKNIVKDYLNDYLDEDTIKYCMNLSKDETTGLLKRKMQINKQSRLDMFKYYFNSDETNFRIGMRLFKEYNPDIMGMLLVGLDPIQHLFWKYSHTNDYIGDIEPKKLGKYSEVIDKYYMISDARLGELLKLDKFDLVVLLSDHCMESQIPEVGIHSGYHDKSPDGILILYGKDIKKNFELKTASVLDIAPTVLYYMGVPQAKDVKGRVLLQAFDNKFVKANPVSYVKTYGANIHQWKSSNQLQEDKDIMENLKALGYIQ